MEVRSGGRGILQGLANRRLFWDLFLGPVYNRMIGWALSDAYIRFADMINPAQHSSVLDVGSGPGFLCFILAERNTTVSITGIDYSRTEVRNALKRLGKRGLRNCDFRVGNAMDLPFPDSSFDTVISFASIKHWPDKVRGLREIRRVLAPAGTALVLEANRECTDDEFKNFTTAFKRWWVYMRLFSWYARIITVDQGLTPDEFRRYAREAGFDEIEVEKVAGGPFIFMTLQGAVAE